MESSVERIISVVQAERETTKELRAKLHEANAEKQELQVATRQLQDNMTDLRRQLDEAVAESKCVCRLGRDRDAFQDRSQFLSDT